MSLPSSPVNWSSAILISDINLPFPMLLWVHSACVRKGEFLVNHNEVWFLSFQLEHLILYFIVLYSLSENYRFIFLLQNTLCDGCCCSAHVDSFSFEPLLFPFKVLSIVASVITWSSNYFLNEQNQFASFFIQTEDSGLFNLLISLDSTIRFR